MIRVDVTTHFNEDGYSYGLAQGIADRLRRELQAVQCSEHGDEASIRVSTQGTAQTLNDITIEVQGCCQPVINQLQRLVDTLRASSLK